jgi:hypothetical protein
MGNSITTRGRTAAFAASIQTAARAHVPHVTGGTHSVRRSRARQTIAASVTWDRTIPQIEIYTESKQGIQFRANIDKMNLDAKPWVVVRTIRQHRPARPAT